MLQMYEHNSPRGGGHSRGRLRSIAAVRRTARRSLNVLAALALAFASLASGPSGTSALTQLDQSQETWDGWSGFSPQYPYMEASTLAQTFTAGASGPLTSVELLLLRRFDTTLDLTLEVRANGPGGALLATSDVVAASEVPATATLYPQESDTGAWMRFGFPTPAEVSVGQTYTLVIPPGPTFDNAYSRYWWASSQNDPYLDGEAWAWVGDATWGAWYQPISNADFTFRTYVDVNASPLGVHDGFEGEVGALRCAAVGWAVDSDDPYADLQVRILADGIPIATGVANLFRQDLLDAGVSPDGYSAFHIDLWGVLKSNTAYLITAQAQDTQTAEWVDLSNTPKTLTCLRGADELRFEGSWTSENLWYNPCTGEHPIVTTDFHITGYVVRDAAGDYHYFDLSVDVDGSDSFGWVVVDAKIVRHSEEQGLVFPDDVTGLVWQLHLRLEDPVTGQVYGGVHVFHGTLNANGELVVFMTNNTGFHCEGQPVWAG